MVVCVSDAGVYCLPATRCRRLADSCVPLLRELLGCLCRLHFGLSSRLYAPTALVFSSSAKEPRSRSASAGAEPIMSSQSGYGGGPQPSGARPACQARGTLLAGSEPAEAPGHAAAPRAAPPGKRRPSCPNDTPPLRARRPPAAHRTPANRASVTDPCGGAPHRPRPRAGTPTAKHAGPVRSRPTPCHTRAAPRRLPSCACTLLTRTLTRLSLSPPQWRPGPPPRRAGLESAAAVCGKPAVRRLATAGGPPRRAGRPTGPRPGWPGAAGRGAVLRAWGDAAERPCGRSSSCSSSAGHAG